VSQFACFCDVVLRLQKRDRFTAAFERDWTLAALRVEGVLMPESEPVNFSLESGVSDKQQ
jgi:hypothetical protein